MNVRPYIWEKSYPPGISWDMLIETTTLPALIERSAARFPDGPAIEFRDRQLLYKDLVIAMAQKVIDRAIQVCGGVSQDFHLAYAWARARDPAGRWPGRSAPRNSCEIRA